MGGLKDTTFSRYRIAIKHTPNQVFSFQLFLVVLTYALAGFPKGWDEGSAASITQLPSFLTTFKLSSGNAVDNQNTISNLNLGAGIGPLLTLPLNDYLGRRWSYRLWMAIFAIGIVIEVTSSGNLSALYAGRIIAGFGIGACTVIGPLGIAECAPRAIRGLLGLCFNIGMITGQVVGVFSVFAVSQTFPGTAQLQWQTPFIVQLLIPVLGICLSFAIPETPRYLLAKGKPEEALAALVKLRNLPSDDSYVSEEFSAIRESHDTEILATGGSGWLVLVKECFTVPNYFRRTRTVIIAYILAQFSGANSITNYLPTILSLIGITDTNKKILFTGGYSISKLVCLVIASLFFVDIVGRRRSLLIGVTIQCGTLIFMAVYLHEYLGGAKLSSSISDLAIAVIYLHSLGWSIGLLPLPYLFGAELFPTRVRSVGGAIGQSFHWLFYFAITKATPSILSSMAGWGAFAFFAACCAIAWVYGFIMVPETSGRSLEDMNALFDLKWYEIRKNAYPTTAQVVGDSPRATDIEHGRNDSEAGLEKVEMNHVEQVPRL